MSDTTIISPKEEDVEYMRIGNTTYKINSIYDGEISFLELIKNAMKREADALLRQMDNN